MSQVKMVKVCAYQRTEMHNAVCLGKQCFGKANEKSKKFRNLR